MNEKKIKSFLINGFSQPEGVEEEERIDREESGEELVDAPSQDGASRLDAIEDELLKIRYILEDLKEREAPAPQLPDLEGYLTTREQIKAIQSSVERKEVEVSNKNLISSMEQIATMREDFFKLCRSMRERMSDMTPEDVLSSFEAYEVDMENILTDSGVYIGPFEYDRLNTIHQRIVGVIDTDDKDKDGLIAERHSDGYKLGNRVLIKEKVSVYKFVAKATETPSETASKEESEEEEKE